MENPLCVAQRKFDVRQWVLVTDWNPLTIWFYDDCYARFAVYAYEDPQKSVEALDGGGIGEVAALTDKWLSNTNRHLVNATISKNSKDFHKTYEAENGETVVDNMWEKDKFKDWITFKTGEDDRWEKKILPRMHKIAKCVLMSAQEKIEHRKGSWELYGFDYMFDGNYEPWLIEVNSSPACDYSTAVTESFVQRALVDILKVVRRSSEGMQAERAKRARPFEHLQGKPHGMFETPHRGHHLVN